MKKKEKVINELIEYLNQGDEDKFIEKTKLYKKYFLDQHLLLHSASQNTNVTKRILDYKVNKNEFFTQLVLIMITLIVFI